MRDQIILMVNQIVFHEGELLGMHYLFLVVYNSLVYFLVQKFEICSSSSLVVFGMAVRKRKPRKGNEMSRVLIHYLCTLFFIISEYVVPCVTV